MDDQRADRVGGGDPDRRLQISLGQLFEVAFWVCVAFGSYAVFYLPRPEYGTVEFLHEIKCDWCAVKDAVALALMAISPFVAIGTLFKRPIIGAIIGFVAGVMLCGSF